MEIKNVFKRNIRVVEKSPLLVFLHIPKTAGTSIQNIFYKEFGQKNIFWHGTPRDGFLRDAFKENGAAYFDRFQLLGGHIKASNPYLQDISRPKIFLSIVRDPFRQIVSHYNHISERPGHKLYTGQNLSDSIATKSKFSKVSTGIQCSIISGYSDFSHASEVIQNNPYIIGNVGNLEAFIQALREKLGLRLNSTLTYKNVAPRQYLQSYNSPELLKLVNDISGQDKKLVEFIGDLYCSDSLDKSTEVFSRQ